MNYFILSWVLENITETGEGVRKENAGFFVLCVLSCFLLTVKGPPVSVSQI